MQDGCVDAHSRDVGLEIKRALKEHWSIEYE